MIPDETVERVRESADIVGVIGEYVDLKRQGADFRGPCPFHQGTGRNFSVSPKKMMYHCFVCGESGNVFTYLMKRLGVDFPTAVRMVGEKSGIDVVETKSGRADEKDTREPLWEVNGAAVEYFRQTLWEDDLGKAARTYLEEREISRELAEKIGIGFAPREIGLMRAYLNTLGFDDDRLIEAGLLHLPEGSTEPRPRFRDRLIFPIYDLSSKVVGFGGRLLGPGEPKYLNSSESAIFSKGKLLYGLNWAKQAARRDERMLVVEGYFDAVRLIGAGIESVVAPMGTALTEDQAKLIRRYTDRVYLLYDSDKAGLKATFRSGDELLAQGASVQVVTLPDGEDPDTYVRTHGARGLETQIGNSIDVFERKIQLLERGGWFGDLRKKRQALDRLLPTLRATTDPLTRALYTEHLTSVSGIPADVLENEARASTRAHAKTAQLRPLAIAQQGAPSPQEGFKRRAPTSTPRPERTHEWPTEREFLRVLVHRPWLIEGVAERIGPTDLSNALTRSLYRGLLDVGAQPEVLASRLEEDAAAILQELLNENAGLDMAERTIAGVLVQFQESELRIEIAELQRQSALASGAEADKLLLDISRLGMQRRALGGRGWNVGGRSAGVQMPSDRRK